MRTFQQFITEGRDAPLYHATRPDAAIRIIQTNELLGSEFIGGEYDEHPMTRDLENAKVYDSKGIMHAVSFSRSVHQAIDYAREWKESPSHVVFEVNQAKLAHNYKLIPYNYFAGGPKGKTRYKGSAHSMNQSEEMVIGDIKNFNKYVLRVLVDDYAKMLNTEINRDLFAVSQHYKLYDMKTKKYINRA